MKKAPYYEVPLSESRFDRRQVESSSTAQDNKQELEANDRPERDCLTHLIYNPSAPFTEEELEAFTQEASHMLGETLNQLEAERGMSC